MRWVCLVMVLVGLGGLGEAWAADLVEVYRQAEREDAGLERARAALAATGETRTQAPAGWLLPDARFTGNVSRVHEDVQLSGTSVGLSGSSTFTNGDYALTLVQPLLHLERYAELKQADARGASSYSSGRPVTRGPCRIPGPPMTDTDHPVVPPCRNSS